MAEEKQSLFKKILDKTVIPDMLKKRREDREFQDEIKKEAQLEAREDIKNALKEKYKQEAVEKAMKKSKPFMEKLKDEFTYGKSMLGDVDGKLNSMLGNKSTDINLGSEGIKSSKDIVGIMGSTRSVADNDRIKSMLPNKDNVVPDSKFRAIYPRTSKESPEDKIKRLLK